LQFNNYAGNTILTKTPRAASRASIFLFPLRGCVELITLQFEWNFFSRVKLNLDVLLFSRVEETDRLSSPTQINPMAMILKKFLPEHHSGFHKFKPNNYYF
jgi:hypothetical protein